MCQLVSLPAPCFHLFYVKESHLSLTPLVTLDFIGRNMIILHFRETLQSGGSLFTLENKGTVTTQGLEPCSTTPRQVLQHGPISYARQENDFLTQVPRKQCHILHLNPSFKSWICDFRNWAHFSTFLRKTRMYFL